MYQRITESDFVQAFDDYNRSENFSIAARIALFNYLESLEDDAEPMELDVIAICCEWSEYTLEDLTEQFDHIGVEHDEDADDDEKLNDWLEALQDNTTAILTDDDTIVMMEF